MKKGQQLHVCAHVRTHTTPREMGVCPNLAHPASLQASLSSCHLQEERTWLALALDKSQENLRLNALSFLSPSHLTNSRTVVEPADNFWQGCTCLVT